LFQYWLVRGDLSQARYWLGRALANGGGQPALQVRALSACAHLAILQGELDMAADHLDTATQLTEQVDQLDDAPSLAYLTQRQGLLALFQGEHARAIDQLEQTLPIFEAASDRTAAQRTLFWLGLAVGLAGDAARAERLHRESMAITEPLQEHWFRWSSLWAMGMDAWHHGDNHRAKDLEIDSLRLVTLVDNQIGVACVFEALAWIAVTDGHHQRAATLFGAAERIATTINVPVWRIPTVATYHEQAQQEARTIGERTYQEALHRGRELTPQQAIAYAL
jgi:non-specific serine/threonine protein kinase